MTKIKKYNQFVKEEIDLRKALTGAALGSSLALGTPGYSSPISTEEIIQVSQQPKVEIDAEKTVEKIREISIVRKTKSTDEELSKILFEIETNLYNKDTVKFTELFDKLTSHLDEVYGYRIKNQNIEQLSEQRIHEKAKGMTLFEILGWLGSICLAICGIPQAWQSYKDKHSEGISWGFVLLWSFGEIFALAYVYDKLDLPLLMNYATNIFILAVILYYKINPKKQNDIKLSESKAEKPGPELKSSKKITISEEDMTLFNDEPSLQKLLMDNKISILDKEVWYNESDEETRKILDQYLEIPGKE